MDKLKYFNCKITDRFTMGLSLYNSKAYLHIRDLGYTIDDKKPVMKCVSMDSEVTFKFAKKLKDVIERLKEFEETADKDCLMEPAKTEETTTEKTKPKPSRKKRRRVSNEDIEG
jgi:hypothetical protein